MVLFFTLIGTLEQLTAQIIGIVYPAFKSFEALESGNLDECQLWLTYWVCFAVMIMFDRLVGSLLLKKIVPFYFFLKLAMLLYLMHPATLGARKVYAFVIVPLVRGNQVQLIRFRDTIAA